MRALLPFTKYHGLGNDFILIDATELLLNSSLFDLLQNWSERVSSLAPILCDRYQGIGADGTILALPPQLGNQEDSSCPGDFPRRHEASDTQKSVRSSTLEEQYKRTVKQLVGHYPDYDGTALSWIYTNSDGSPAEICGNGLRCVAQWAYSRRYCSQSFMVDTVRGKLSAVIGDDATRPSVTVDLGIPTLGPDQIPLNLNNKTEDYSSILDIEDRKFSVISVGMGNPHCIIFQDMGSLFQPYDKELGRLARAIQVNPLYPAGVNVEFVKVISRDLVRCIVYERGCGFTKACASAAAAVLAAGVLDGRLARKATVELPGGRLALEWAADNKIYIQGPANEVFTGVMRLPDP
ncbi:MAG: diaminopimelate epimerase, partial [Cyanobacteria bacterium]|nr:diaminopimelate epimerase [Cyanobacteriota bacterium]